MSQGLLKQSLELIREDAEQFQDNVDTFVFGSGVLIVLAATVALLIAPTFVEEAATTFNELLWSNVDWFYLATMLLLVVFCLLVAVTPWGGKRLGEDDPEYSLTAYLAMMFSAGIAAGIVFWGPAEAIMHYEWPSPFVGGDDVALTSDAATGALQYTLFHWGFTAWAAYVALALPIAYFAYNHGAPLRVSSILTPFVGVERLDSPLAKVVDVLAVFATLGGLATTTGLVSQQIMAGVSFQFGLEVGSIGVVLVITALTIVLTISAVSGINRGIRRISVLNVGAFAVFTALIVAVGEPGAVGEHSSQAVSGYAVDFVSMSLYLDGGEWSTLWTLFYWAWWLSWAPFVGLFFARISRGRTVRQLVLGGMIVPAVATIVWFLVMGATALEFQQTGQADILGVLYDYGYDEGYAGYPVLDALPYGTLLSVGFLGLAVTWLVTSADSAAYSLGLLSSKDAVVPAITNRMFWGGFQGVIAATLFLAGGENALQQTAIVVGSPFALIALIAVFGLLLEFAWRPGGLAPPGGGEDDADADDVVLEGPDEPAEPDRPTDPPEPAGDDDADSPLVNADTRAGNAPENR